MTMAPFSFGAPGVTANPFAKEKKKEMLEIDIVMSSSLFMLLT